MLKRWSGGLSTLQMYTMTLNSPSLHFAIIHRVVSGSNLITCYPLCSSKSIVRRIAYRMYSNCRMHLIDVLPFDLFYCDFISSFGFSIACPSEFPVEIWFNYIYIYIILTRISYTNKRTREQSEMAHQYADINTLVYNYTENSLECNTRIRGEKNADDAFLYYSNIRMEYQITYPVNLHQRIRIKHVSVVMRYERIRMTLLRTIYIY